MSFGYNQVEDESHSLSGPDAVRLLIDVSSNGGNVLLNVGPDAEGNIPPVQLRCLEAMGDWMEVNGDAVNGTTPVEAEVAKPQGGKRGDWVRWLRKGDRVFAFVDGNGRVTLPVNPEKVDLSSAKLLSGEKVEIGEGGVVDMPKLPTKLRPAGIELRAL